MLSLLLITLLGLVPADADRDPAGTVDPFGGGRAWDQVRGGGAGGRHRPEGVWPLSPEPRVVQGFSPPAQRWLAGHRGVDLAGRSGQGVLAALPGQVSFAGSVGGKPVVVVDHGEVRTTYEPVAALVEKGDAVQAGDRLGLLMLPFSHCYPTACLHWGLRRGEEYLDPLSLVGGERVRLLPLWSARPVPDRSWPDHDEPTRSFRLAGGLGGRPVGAGPS